MSTKLPKLILLHGFRGTGKSTIAAMLGTKLNWKILEMDEEIQNVAGKTIGEIIKDGKDWLSFRKLEQQILQQALIKSNLIISTGGGLAVNNIVDPESGKTFGEKNLELIKKTEQVCNILLIASESEIAKRIREAELRSNSTVRPMFKANEEENETKEEKINKLIADSLAMYKIRKPLYNQITNIIFDTSIDTPERVVEKIMNLFK